MRFVKVLLKGGQTLLMPLSEFHYWKKWTKKEHERRLDLLAKIFWQDYKEKELNEENTLKEVRNSKKDSI